MGERSHLGGPKIGVETHVTDVVAVLEQEDLGQVVLCGHSYGGIPVTGAADRQPERVRLLVYIDALVPSDGESAFDLVPATFAEVARKAGDQYNKTRLTPSARKLFAWLYRRQRGGKT